MDISPDSRYILLRKFNWEDLKEQKRGSDSLVMIDSETGKTFFTLNNIDERRIFDAFFIDEKRIFIRGENKCEIYTIGCPNKLIQDSLIEKLNGEHFRIFRKEGLIFFLQPDISLEKFTIFWYDIKDNRTDKYSFYEDIVNLSDFVLYNKDTLIIAFSNKFVMLSINMKTITPLLDISDKDLTCNESSIAITNDESKLLYSDYEDYRFMCFDMKSRMKKEVIELKSCFNPKISPDNSFMIVEKINGRFVTPIIYKSFRGLLDN